VRPRQPPDRLEEDQSGQVGQHFKALAESINGLLDKHPLLAYALTSSPSMEQEVEPHSAADKNQFLKNIIVQTKCRYSLRKDRQQSPVIPVVTSERAKPSEGAAPADNPIAFEDTPYAQFCGKATSMQPSEGVVDNPERHRISNSNRLLHCLSSSQLDSASIQSACTEPPRLVNPISISKLSSRQSGHSSNIQCSNMLSHTHFLQQEMRQQRPHKQSIRMGTLHVQSHLPQRDLHERY
jgi:hypothetical protein